MVAPPNNEKNKFLAPPLLLKVRNIATAAARNICGSKFI